MRVPTLKRLARIGLLAGGMAAAGDLVVLSFTVTDNKGKYVNGLKPSDFKILEDGINEKLSTFSEGNRPAMQIMDDGSLKPLLPAEQAEGDRAPGSGPDGARSDAFVGTNVFVLFDTTSACGSRWRGMTRRFTTACSSRCGMPRRCLAARL